MRRSSTAAASCSGKRKSLKRRTKFQPFETWRRKSDCRDAPRPSTPCTPSRKPPEARSRIAAPDYLVTAIKGNQETILEDLKDIDRTSEPHDSCETLDKEHGRIERRRCDAVDLAAPEWDGCCDHYGRKQAIRIRRTIECVKTGKISEDTTYCLTSLDRNRADSSMLLRIVREHWHIENRLHYVRDWTCDEDRCRAHVHHTPRNLARLSKAAISVIRFEGRFQYMPPANR